MKNHFWKAEFEKVVTRYHITACWAAVFLNPIWTISDYFICASHWIQFLVVRILISLITFCAILLRNKLNSVTLAMVPFLSIAFQNAYMYSVMDVEAVQNHTFAYIALFIGAGMFLVWKPVYSIVVVVSTLILNILLFSFYSPLSYTQMLMNGGMLTFTVSVFTVLLAHTRYVSVKRSIILQIALRDNNAQITSQKEIIERNAIELQDINTKLSRFAYVISHDLKAPLRGVKNLASWIEEDKDNKFSPESAEYLALLKAQAENMDKLINGILHYSKASAGRLEREKVNLNELIRDISSLYVIQGAQVTVAAVLPVIIYNRATMIQVFQNLISNAVKHNDKEIKKIKIFCLDNGHYFEFIVSDNGPGIAVVHQERIFELFQTLSANKENTGIGLPVIKKLIDDAGGRIWVESSAGQGTSFRFLLPKILFNEVAPLTGETLDPDKITMAGS